MPRPLLSQAELQNTCRAEYLRQQGSSSSGTNSSSSSSGSGEERATGSERENPAPRGLHKADAKGNDVRGNKMMRKRPREPLKIATNARRPTLVERLAMNRK